MQTWSSASGRSKVFPCPTRAPDVVISNCVINLSTEKERVFHEAFRVLKSGGRTMISDIMLTENLPEKLMENVALFAGCVSGAILKEDYVRLMRDAGFSDITIVREKPAGDMFGPEDEAGLRKAVPGLTLEELRRVGRSIVSVQLAARA
jgi:arsenite methyltransferase